MGMLTDMRIHRLETRISVLEEQIFKKVKRLRATESQRFLIIYHLGLIPEIQKLDISQNQKDLIVSVMLDIDKDNAKKYLAETAKKKKPLLDTISNYSFLVDFFEKTGLTKISITVERKLNALKADKELTS
jgi:hypothetical protein